MKRKDFLDKTKRKKYFYLPPAVEAEQTWKRKYQTSHVIGIKVLGKREDNRWDCRYIRNDRDNEDNFRSMDTRPDVDLSEGEIHEAYDIVA